MPDREVREVLTRAGLTREQMQQVTGFGARRLSTCKPDDTILRKVATGALSVEGAQRVLGIIE